MNKKALTIIEIVVATVILSLVLLSLAYLFVTGRRMVAHSRARMSAAELSKIFLDPLQNEVNEAQWSANCVGAGICLPRTQADANNPGITYTANYTSNGVAGTQARRVTATINWSEPAP